MVPVTRLLGLVVVLSMTLMSRARAEPAQANGTRDDQQATAAEPHAEGKHKEERREEVAEAEEGLGGEQEFNNGLLFGFSHAFHLLQNRESAIGSELPETEHFYGFLFGYERVLHRFVALSIIKPFYFNHERVDSPLEIIVSAIYRKNSWEPFLGAGIVSTIRSFDTDRGEAEGNKVEFTVGLLFVAGFKYFITPQWAIELEFGYSFVPGNTTFEHEFADSYQGAYFF